MTAAICVSSYRISRARSNQVAVGSKRTLPRLRRIFHFPVSMLLFCNVLEEQPLNLIDNKTALTPRNIEWQIFVALLIDFSGPSGNLSFDSLTFPLGENPIRPCCLSKRGQ
jgi:hypothetical protein